MTPDVNVLVAASRSDHSHHVPALAWLQTALASCVHGRGFTVLPMVAVSYLRIVTNSRVFVNPTPLADAQIFLNAVLVTPGVQMPGTGAEWPIFEHLCAEYGLQGNDVQDAWIAAAVRANHELLVTFDRGFKRWLSARELTVLASGA